MTAFQKILHLKRFHRELSHKTREVSVHIHAYTDARVESVRKNIHRSGIAGVIQIFAPYDLSLTSCVLRERSNSRP